jgi:hypothetical protein
MSTITSTLAHQEACKDWRAKQAVTASLFTGFRSSVSDDYLAAEAVSDEAFRKIYPSAGQFNSKAHTLVVKLGNLLGKKQTKDEVKVLMKEYSITLTIGWHRPDEPANQKAISMFMAEKLPQLLEGSAEWVAAKKIVTQAHTWTSKSN